MLAVLTGGLAALIWGIKQGQPGNGADSQQETAGESGAMQAPRENAVLVFGSTGKLGRQIVTQVSLSLLQDMHAQLISVISKAVSVA